MTQDDLNNLILLANQGVARLTASANGVFAEIQVQINTQANAAAEAAAKGAVAPAPEPEAPVNETESGAGEQLERVQGE